MSKEDYMNRRGVFVPLFLIVLGFSVSLFSAEQPKKIRPAAGRKDSKEGKKAKGIKPAGYVVVDVKYEDFAKMIREETGRSLKDYNEILKEEISPKSEFETEEQYRKRLEGSSRDLNIKKTQIIEETYKRRKYYRIREMSVELPKYNAEEQLFDMKIVTLPLIENVIFQPPEEESGLRLVPSENGIDLILRYKVNPGIARKLREKDKFIKADLLFTSYLSLKDREDLNIYNVVALSELDVYKKEGEKTDTIFTKSLRVNTPTFPKRD